MVRLAAGSAVFNFGFHTTVSHSLKRRIGGDSLAGFLCAAFFGDKATRCARDLQ